MNPTSVFKVKVKISITPALAAPRGGISDSSFPNAVRSFHNRAALGILN